MKYYKKDDEIYAFEDNLDSKVLAKRILDLGLTNITETEVESIQTQKELAYKQTDEYLANLANSIRAKRDTLMSKAQGRVDRYKREVAMGITTTDDISIIYAYMQALADIPEQEGFPTDVEFPKEV